MRCCGPHRGKMAAGWVGLTWGRGLTWGLVLGVAAGVHQNVGLKGGVKVVICTEEGGPE